MLEMGFHTAKDDFRNARRKAAIQKLLATLKRESVGLVAFEEGSEQLDMDHIRELGVKNITFDQPVLSCR